MSITRATYLLPCSCGRSLPVETSQAGDMVRCECGQSLEVPTMREIRKLSPADEAVSDESTWGQRQGLMLFGALLGLAGCAAACYLWYQIPARPAFDVDAMIQAEHARIEKMSVSETWFVWVATIEATGLQKLPNQSDNDYQVARNSYLYGIYFSLALAACGAVVALIAFATHGLNAPGQAQPTGQAGARKSQPPAHAP